MIRNATPEDFEAVYALICTLEETQFDRERMRRIYEAQQKNDQFYSLVNEEDGRVSGFLNMRVEEQLHHGAAVAEVLELVVDPQHRSGGVGSGLLRTARAAAREAGCVQIELCCNQRRTNAHRFYTREGLRNTHYNFTLPFAGEET